jgi:uncharacterized membrane protein (TIGR02234 family)
MSTTRRVPPAWLAASAAGAGAVLLAAGREWATVRFSAAVPSGGHGPAGTALTGGDLVPFLGPAALAALAAVVAVLATRGRARRVVGGVLAILGAAIAAAPLPSVTGDRVVRLALERNPFAGVLDGPVAQSEVVWAWPALTVLGGVVLLAGGVVAALRGGRWTGMSSRYDRQGSTTGGSEARGAPPGPASDRELWDALDRGTDPTTDPTTDADADAGTDAATRPAEPGTRPADPGT